MLTAWSWAAGVLEQYVSEIRPLFGFDEHPALWLTQRGGRISGRDVDERFAGLRDELGRDRMPTPHALRHSYVTHLHEEGFDALFVKEQVGHRYMSTTSLYTVRELGLQAACVGRSAGRAADGDGAAVTGNLDYRWRLRELMALRGLFATADLAPLLAAHGIKRSDSQVWRLITGRPERLNLCHLIVLCEILDCKPDDLVERVEAVPVKKRAASGRAAGGNVVPKPARVSRPDGA